jgi:hypothetical protein
MLDFERRRDAGRAGSGAGGGTGAVAAGGGSSPPDSPFTRPTASGEGGGDKKKYLVYAAGALATGAALYLGLAFGSSLQSGGGGSGGGSNADLPTPVSGVTQAACPGPVTMNQDARVTLTFANIPDGYRIDEKPGIRPVSQTATVTQVDATAQEGNSILFKTAAVPNSAGRTDEYQITAQFSKSGDKKQEQCTVRVTGPAAPAGSPSPTAPTATVPASTSPTSTPVPPTATRVPVTQPTAVPTAVPTQAAPTSTPDLSTATPSVPTPVPTAGGTLISPTQVPTTAPATSPTATFVP